MMSPVLLDARPVTSDRISGWERYTRNVLGVAATLTNVRILAPNADGAMRRIRSDISLGLCRPGEGSVMHFPAAPPPVWVRHRSLVTIHDLTWWRYPETASFLGRNYYRRAAEVHCRRAENVIATVSRAMADEIGEHFADLPVRVVPNVVTMDSVSSEESPIPITRPYLLTVASVEPRKNLQRLLQAFQHSALWKDMDLVLVGRQAWGDKPTGHVRSTGFVSDGQLAGLYRGATGVVSPSLYEGFGLAVAESRSLGVPVACSSISAHREVAADGTVWFDPLDVDSMAAGLRTLAERPHHVPSNPFTRDRLHDSLRSVYQEMGV